MDFKQIVAKEEFDKTLMKKIKKLSVLEHESTYYGPGKYVLASFHTKHIDHVKNMETKPNDLWVQGGPRCGTNWASMMTWLINNDLDYSSEQNDDYRIRVTSVERFCTGNFLNQSGCSDKDWENIVAYFNSVSPRQIKTHYPLSLLPDGILEGKLVHVARDPRDAAVSLYCMKKSMRAENADIGSFKEFWGLFVEDKIQSTPYFLRIKEIWAKLPHPNVLVIFYEDMVQDLASVARKIARFLGKQNYTEDEISALCEYMQFDNVKAKNKKLTEDFNSVSSRKKPNEDIFFRKGGVGGWREHFDEEMRQQAKRWMSENIDSIGMQVPASWREWD